MSEPDRWHPLVREFVDVEYRRRQSDVLLTAFLKKRWIELPSYVHALVYHRRDPAEVPALERMILSCARMDEQSRELSSMGQTYAEYLEQKELEKGREEGLRKGEIRARRAILVRLLQSRFDEVPSEVAARIEVTSDIATLDRWLDRLLHAGSIADVGIV